MLAVTVPPPGDGTPALRAARPDDVPALAALQDAAQAPFDVAVPHSAPRWRWLLGHDASDLWVLERGGAVVACADEVDELLNAVGLATERGDHDVVGEETVGLVVAALVDPQPVAGDQVGQLGAVGEFTEQGFGSGHEASQTVSFTNVWFLMNVYR